MEELSVRRASELENTKKLLTGCKKIDEKLRGGLPNQGIIEISGESGSGKSQLCMQLCLTVQYPVASGGLGGSAVYICTEHKFPTKRLQEMITNFPDKFPNSTDTQIAFSDNIYIDHVADFETLKTTLEKRIPALIQRKNIKLIIIDSIAAIFRGTYEKSEGLKRTQDMRRTGQVLHKHCADHGVMVVCVNQVTDVVGKENADCVAALGLAWANLVTNRFQLYKHSDGTRKFAVVFSPCLAQGFAEFVIGSSGVS